MAQVTGSGIAHRVKEGTPGSPGSDAILYRAEASAETIIIHADNSFAPTSLPVYLYKITGLTKTNIPGYVRYYYSNDGTNFVMKIEDKTYSWAYFTFSPNPNYLNYKAVKVEFYSDNTFSTLLTSKTINIVKDGTTGKAGLTFRETEWAAGVYFRNDVDLDTSPRYLDIVIVYNSAGGLTTPLGVKFDMYEAKAAHNGVVSSSDNKPGSGTSWSSYWQQVNQMLPIYTPLLLARLIKASEIDVDSLVAKLLKTANSGPRVEIFGSMLNVYGNFAAPNIKFGVNANGQTVLTYYDNNGNKIYDLGPKGFDWGSIVPSSWSSTRLTKICDVLSGDVIPTWSNITSQALTSIKDVSDTTGSNYYQYYAGSNPALTESDRANEQYLFVSESVTGTKISDGWYARSFTGKMQYMSQNTYDWIKPDPSALYEYTAGVKDQDPIYMDQIIEYIGGVVTRQIDVYWNELIIEY